MSADTTSAVMRPLVCGLDPIPGTRFVGQARADPVIALATRMRGACAAAVDVDEVAALLEVSGINDRVAARDYAVPTVFALAGRVLDCARETHAAEPSRDGAPVARTGRVEFAAMRATLVRSVLYLTPFVAALGAGDALGGVPALATIGTLIVGWGAGQLLAYLGYGVLNRAGIVGAARLLAVGFAVIAAVWMGVLLAVGTVGPRGLAVAGAQLALFAATAVALVTGRERTVLAWAMPCWLAAGAGALGAGTPAIVALLVALAALVVAAYTTAVRRGGGGWWRPAPRHWRPALLLGAVGAGQATLFVIVVLGAATSAIPIEALPLFAGVPFTELTLVWHQGRVAREQAALDSRAAYERRLLRVTSATIAALAVPIVAGGGLGLAYWLGAAVPGGPHLASATLLTAAYALTLLLVAHGRTGTAAVLVWWPAALIWSAGRWAPDLMNMRADFVSSLAIATLLGACLPALVVAAATLRDPESYR